MEGTRAKQELIRPLGYNELYQVARYALDQYRGTSMLCRYAIPRDFAGQKVQTKLRQLVNGAVAGVISKSPTLQAVISGHASTKPVWIELETVDLNEHIEWITLDETNDSDSAIQKMVQSQLDTRFFDMDTKPGWRVVVVQHDNRDVLEILFTWNHPHADGMSGRIFHELLLDELASMTNNGTFKSFNATTLKTSGSHTQFPPTIESLVGLPVTPLYVLKEAWNDYKPPSLFPQGTEARWAPIRTFPYKTCFESFTIPQSILAKVVGSCRDQGTTLTGLLNVLALVSLASLLDAQVAPAFASSTAIDQRRFVPTRPPSHPWLEPKKTIGNFVSIMTHVFERELVAKIRAKTPVGPADRGLSPELMDLIWPTAKRVRREIQNRLEMGLHNDVLGLARFVPDWRKQFLRDVKRPRKLSWFVTNLGMMDESSAIEQDRAAMTAGWSIQRAQFTLSTEIPVAALLIGAASVRGEALVLTCTWQETVVDPALVRHFMRDLERFLVQIGSQ